MLKNNKNNSGQVLIEAIVAIAVVAFVLAGIVAALIAAVNNSTFAKNQNIATNFSQEGINFMRDQKESDYTLFSTQFINKEYCLGQGATKITTNNTICSKNIAKIFTRKIYVNPLEDLRSGQGIRKCDKGIFVASIVSWNDSKCKGSNECHRVELNTCFTNLSGSSI